ncbi:putative F-box protein At3g17620 isoform X2 [Brassica napus]|uniref:putative F-box protein At3g17620 isoform X2 n=1 Tax=Brassica napus TaxID=3708 RepID=UPI0006AACAEB|nr:putative F-box protein At3g17620 isoform X2 [Brassica napus]
MNNLSKDLLEEILSRVPTTSLRKVRSTCKKWNTLSKVETFTKKHLAQSPPRTSKGEILAIVLINCSLRLMSVNLNDFDHPSIKLTGTLISLNSSDKLDITQVYHCEGLLLCVTEDYARLVLWNPYTGESRWICVDHSKYAHALGFEEGNPCRAYKVLRFAHHVHEIYDGNVYWFAQDKEAGGNVPGFILCFDFTTERFAPRLPLPFESYFEDEVTLSNVGEEQLAVLFQNLDTYEMEVWVTTKVEPNGVSWSKFLAVDMSPLTWFQFFTGGSFLIDEERRVVVVFDGDKNVSETSRNIAYFIGENDYFKEVDLGEVTTCEVFPHAFSYVPSSVQIN